MRSRAAGHGEPLEQEDQRGQHDVGDNISLMLAKHKPPERQQPEIVAGTDPLFRQIAFGQESENPPADR